VAVKADLAEGTRLCPGSQEQHLNSCLTEMLLFLGKEVIFGGIPLFYETLKIVKHVN